jgi:hypothetical protein
VFNKPCENPRAGININANIIVKFLFQKRNRGNTIIKNHIKYRILFRVLSDRLGLEVDQYKCPPGVTVVHNL